MSVLKTGMDFRGQSRKWHRQGSEIRVRIWRTGWHTPIKKSEEDLLGHHCIDFQFSILEGKYHFQNKSPQLILKRLHEMICKMQHTSYGKIRSIHEKALKKRGETNHGHSSEIQTTEKWVKLRSGSYLKQSSSESSVDIGRNTDRSVWYSWASQMNNT